MKDSTIDKIANGFTVLTMLQIALYPAGFVLLIWAANSRFF